MPMSPWRAAAVEIKTGREAASPPVFAAGVAPRSCHHAKPPRINTATINQIHQRLLRVDAFSVVYCPGFLESAEFACCSVTCTPQIDEGQSPVGNRSCAPSIVWMRRTFVERIGCRNSPLPTLPVHPIIVATVISTCERGAELHLIVRGRSGEKGRGHRLGHPRIAEHLGRCMQERSVETIVANGTRTVA